MRMRLYVLAFLALAANNATAQQRLTSDVVRDPSDAAFVYDDIENFVSATEAIADGMHPAEAIRALYLDRASPGLLMFVEKYDLTVERLLTAMEEYPEEYARVGSVLDALREQEPSFVQTYKAIARTLPGAVFPPTYFVVAGHRGIGSGSIEGPLISIEKNTPESIRGGDIEPTLVHEMIHMEQLAAAGEAYFDIFSGDERTLLALSIREGAATWFAEVIAGGSRHKNEARDYYLAHEQELWREFSDAMFGLEMGDWLWEDPANPDQPRDLGYVIGARIVETYYQNAADQGRAAMEIMAITDYPDFLERSGYMGELRAREHPYVPPADPQVLETLDDWQNRKFGLLMHWGLYAQLGIVESWALCSEDQSFQDRGGVPYTEFKEMYFGLIREFNPVQFDPAPWASAARDAGMRYVVFTTKHHDGFSMWDTRQTDFRITGPDSPFRDHLRANIAREVFEAFRAEDFMVGTYFSKPDWHHPDYWSPLWATPNRNNNYDIRKYPEKWQSFRDFTFDQVEELMTTMGRVDILWLDGGWVRPDSTINDEVRSWGYDIAPWEQDIDMPRIAAMARGHQPGLLIVDRTVHGEFENYRTPEQRVPPGALPYPWETNMTLTQSWGHNNAPVYKSVDQLIHTLIDVVSKGGNYLLNVAPTPEGTFEEEAYATLAEIGRWMKVNGEGIYATRQHEPFGEGKTVRFTRSKDGRTVYVFSLDWPGEALHLRSVRARDGGRITLLGDDRPLDWSQDADGLRIQLPPDLEDVGNHALVFRVDAAR